jgi:Tol biopolymer transport system component
VFVTGSSTNKDIWRLRLGEGKGAEPLLKSEYNELQPSISPDGRWIAYASDESGTWEVHVQTYPGLGQKRTVSVGGGAEPLWSHDGKELYYISANHMLMAVDVRLGAALMVGKPRPLFKAPITWNAGLYRLFYRRHYAVTPDGSRFVMTAVDPAGGDPLNVVVRWTDGLRF